MYNAKLGHECLAELCDICVYNLFMYIIYINGVKFDKTINNEPVQTVKQGFILKQPYFCLYRNFG